MAATTFALVIRGAYALPASAGPAVGVNRLEVFDLVRWNPGPTIDDN